MPCVMHWILFFLLGPMELETMESWHQHIYRILLLEPTLDIHYRACVSILGNSNVVYRKTITLSCRSREAIHELKESDDSKST